MASEPAKIRSRSISVVTPTYYRPGEINQLLDSLSRQTYLPLELIIVDGAPADEQATEKLVAGRSSALPFRCRYIRRGGGTAIQRNAGIDIAQGDFISFIDDDISLEPDFFEQILLAYEQDRNRRVGGIAGYITNQHLDPDQSPRWRWYRRLHLFTTYEPGRYDYQTGYPINRYLQPPHAGIRTIDFMGSNCAVWRREVFASGLRFSPFFSDYGVLEDAHLALRAGRDWTLWECGQARCVHHRSPRGRVSTRRLAWKTAVNYRYVFVDIVPQRNWKQELRFWSVQAVDLVRLCAHALRSREKGDWPAVLGKVEGIFAAMRLKKAGPVPSLSSAAVSETRACSS